MSLGESPQGATEVVVVEVQDEPTQGATEVRVDARRTRFREAVRGLSTRAASGDLLRQILLPAAVLVMSGISLMIMGWWGAAKTHREIEQIPYLISGGLLGLSLVVLGGLLLATAVWMSTMERMRKEGDERLGAILAATRAEAPPATVVVEAPPEPEPAPAAPVRKAAKPRNGARVKAPAS